LQAPPPPKKKKRDTEKPSASSAKTTTNKRTSAPNKSRERSNGGKATAGPSKVSGKRKAAEAVSDDESDAEDSEQDIAIAKAPILREIERHIPKADFRKWPTPTEKQQEDLRLILKAAEAPALMTFRGEKARREGQRAISVVSNK
jgi:hypothetical protein